MNSALVISLDFELRWGVLGRCPPGAPYELNVLGARRAIPRMIELFESRGVGATWATVGFLFAANRDELEAHKPALRPRYGLGVPDSYDVVPGKDEASDPLHYGASIVALLAAAPRQELATHTFAHYFCNEAGQDADTFRADLEAARNIAATRQVSLRSIVFPRNQHNPVYDTVLAEQGIIAYRGNPGGWMWRFSDAQESATPGRRIARLADNYLPVNGPAAVPWAEIPSESGLSNVRASTFLKPYSARLAPLDGIRLARIRHSMMAAARTGAIYHLWWHPHNFGRNTDENLAFLNKILDIFAECRDRFGMESLTMEGVAEKLGHAR